MAAALELLSVPATIATAWLAAAGGWLGSELLAQLALAWLTAAARHEMRGVTVKVDELVAEWGEPASADKPGKEE